MRRITARQCDSGELANILNREQIKWGAFVPPNIAVLLDTVRVELSRRENFLPGDAYGAL